MKVSNICYKFLQSFLVLTVFLSLISIPNSSQAGIYTFNINQNNGDVSISVTPAFTPTNLRLEMKPTADPDTSYTTIGDIAVAPFDWGTLTSVPADSYTFKVTDTVMGIAETHDLIVYNHTANDFIFDYTINGNTFDLELIKNPSAPTTEFQKLVLSVDGVDNPVEYGTTTANGDAGPYVWTGVTLGDGNYNIRSKATFATFPLRQQTIFVKVGTTSATPPGGDGFPEIPDAFTFDDFQEFNGNLIITTTYNGTLTLESMKLYYENTTLDPGNWVQAATYSTSPPLTYIWNYGAEPGLRDLEPGLYNFKVEAIAHTPGNPSIKFNPFGIDQFEVLGSLFEFHTEELTFGNLGVEVIPIPEAVSLVNSVKLFIKDIGTATWDPSHFVREETSGFGGQFQWGSKKPAVDVLLEKLDPGDYDLKVETTINNPNGPGTITVEQEHTVTVVGKPLEFSYEELNRDIGIEFTATQPASFTLGSLELFVKKASEPDSHYTLVRIDLDQPYKFGVLDPFNTDSALLGLDLGLYHAKAALYISGEGDPNNYPEYVNGTCPIDPTDANPGPFDQCLIQGYDDTVSPWILHLRYAEVFEFEVKDIVTDNSLLDLLNDIYSKEYEFEVNIENLHPDTYSNLNNVNIKLIPSDRVNPGDLNGVELIIKRPSLPDTTLGAKGNNPATWTWGPVNSVPMGSTILEAQIDMKDRIITKSERLQISNDIHDPADHILGDRIGDVIDLETP